MNKPITFGMLLGWLIGTLGGAWLGLWLYWDAPRIYRNWQWDRQRAAECAPLPTPICDAIGTRPPDCGTPEREAWEAADRGPITASCIAPNAISAAPIE